MACLCCVASAAPADGAPGKDSYPVGVWNCLVYGPYGDQRAFLRLAPDRKTYIARYRDASQRRWVALSDWRASRGRVTFTDPTPDREFVAEADRSTLAGTWRTASSTGGWWCSPVAAGEDVSRPPSPAALMTELVPAIMASPNYPRQAIREAKEGRAVSCFFVHGNGDISNAELLELSDEIFGEPTLSAVAVSRYRGWNDEEAVRPACRSFTFELDAIR